MRKNTPRGNSWCLYTLLVQNQIGARPDFKRVSQHLFLQESDLKFQYFTDGYITYKIQ